MVDTTIGADGVLPEPLKELDVMPATSPFDCVSEEAPGVEDGIELVVPDASFGILLHVEQLKVDVTVLRSGLVFV